jgi:hypothetical protein
MSRLSLVIPGRGVASPSACHSRPERSGGEGNPGLPAPTVWIPFPALRAAGDDTCLTTGVTS